MHWDEIAHIIAAVLHGAILLNSITQVYRSSNASARPRVSDANEDSDSGEDELEISDDRMDTAQAATSSKYGLNGNSSYNPSGEDLWGPTERNSFLRDHETGIGPTRAGNSANRGPLQEHKMAPQPLSAHREKLVIHGLNLIFSVIRIADWSYTSKNLSVKSGASIKITFSRIAVSLFFTLVSYVATRWYALCFEWPLCWFLTYGMSMLQGIADEVCRYARSSYR